MAPTFVELEACVRDLNDMTLVVACREAPHTEIAVLRSAQARDHSDDDRAAVAYARLFAAAPELLAACEAARDRLDVDDGLAQQLRAALIKARGVF